MNVLWLWVDFYGLLDDVCHYLCLACHLERDFRVWGSLYSFLVFLEREFWRVRICMGLFDSFRVWGLFLRFHDVFIVLVRLERECSA